MVVWERDMAGTYIPVALLGTPGAWSDYGTSGAMHDNGDVVCLSESVTIEC